MKMEYILNNGNKIPGPGFGTWKIIGNEGAAIISEALRIGYRHIDTAELYHNQEIIGNILKKCGVNRKDLYITGKLHNEVRGYQETKDAIESTLRELQSDYLDLYLIHWPKPRIFKDCYLEKNIESWRAMEDMVRAGNIKSVGVSNFLEHHLRPLLREASIKPVVNQIEFHPYYSQNDILQYCMEENILIEAWSPLGNGKCLESNMLKSIAQKNHITVPQVCILYVMQKGMLPIIKAATSEHMRENLQIPEKTLDEMDMEIISNLPNTIRIGRHPDDE